MSSTIERTPVRTPVVLEEDDMSPALRPHGLADFVGQADTMRNLATFIRAALIRGVSLDHVLLNGPPGLGKTTIAQIIAHEMNCNLKGIIGPAVQRAADLAAVLTTMQPNEVLFIDEIHRVQPAAAEILYGAMEDFTLDILIGEGPQARCVRIDLPRFTLIGATTRSGSLPAPLRDRFGIHLGLEFYSPEDLVRIVTRSAGMLGIGMMPEGAMEIARRSRGTPRIANRLLRRVHDFAVVAGVVAITDTIADMALSSLAVDRRGLDKLDRRYIDWIDTVHGGGPVGIDTLATGLGEARETIEDVIEPFLVASGIITRTSRGRVLTPKAYEVEAR